MAKPVFLFASSWRSGSTLVQRYIVASGQVFVWGETGGALDSLRDALDGWRQITARSDKRFANGKGGGGEQEWEKLVASSRSEHCQQWIANVTPHYVVVADHVRKLLVDLYESRAAYIGYPRWGIKETRSDLATAEALRVLFPDAKFVFLVRDPMAVMLSIKRHDWLGRPHGASTLKYFADHWCVRAREFRTAEFGIRLRYEDFVADAALRKKLMDYLEIDTLPPDDFTSTSHVDWEAQDHSELDVLETIRLRHWFAAEMKAWGY